MFTSAGLGEAHNWRLYFLQEVSASVLFRRHSGLGKWPPGSWVTVVGSEMAAPVACPDSLSAEGAPFPLHGDNLPWRPPPLSQVDVLCCESLSVPSYGKGHII